MFRSRKISNVEKVMNEVGIDTRSGFGKFTLEKIVASKLQDKVIHHIDVQRLMGDDKISSFLITDSSLIDLAEGQYRSNIYGPGGPCWLISICDYEVNCWKDYLYYLETNLGKEVKGHDVS